MNLKSILDICTINFHYNFVDKTSIIIGTQLPEGQEAIARLRQLESYKNM